MSCVAASPNDPIFINHHANIDCILEQWLWENNNSYPNSKEIRRGHRGGDYIVPFIPVYTHKDMFKTADNFGYECSAAFSLSTIIHTGLISATISLAVNSF